jgi:hypothetical protein
MRRSLPPTLALALTVTLLGTGCELFDRRSGSSRPASPHGNFYGTPQLDGAPRYGPAPQYGPGPQPSYPQQPGAPAAQSGQLR